MNMNKEIHFIADNEKKIARRRGVFFIRRFFAVEMVDLR